MKLLVFLFLCSCKSFPPLTIGAGFMGATVDISTPGWSAPVSIKHSTVVDTPVLMVPMNTQNAPSIATVNDTSTVPVIKAPVSVPILAVPTVKPYSGLTRF